MSLPEPTSAERAGWAAYLDDDERLVWVGAPEPGLRASGSDLAPTAFGLLFFAFSVVWVWQASGPGAPWFFPFFGLPFVVVGAYLTVGRYFWEAWLRGRTRYALTDRRAIIAVNGLIRSLKSYPLSSAARLELLDGDPGTVNFATRLVRGRRSVREVAVGFEYIADARGVFALMRSLHPRESLS